MDDMENEDIAAAMGFSSFGGTKKRKYDQSNSPKSKPDASGANMTRLGVRSKVEHGTDAETQPSESVTGPEVSVNSGNRQSKKQPAADGLAAFLSRGKNLPERPGQKDQNSRDLPRENSDDPGMISFGGPAITRAELASLRSGVRDDNGDLAYFLPSFVQDPWNPTPKGRK